MKCFNVFLFLFCAVITEQVADALAKNRDDDDDRWIWGQVDENKNNKNEDRSNGQISSSTVFPPYDDPCAEFHPTKPSFKASGRAISDEKCAEYKWDKLRDEEIMKRTRECNRKNNPGQFYPAAVGGRPTYAGEFPHMGAIGWKEAFGDGYAFKCGATLISSKFVLTAAHCSKASAADTSLADPIPKIVRLNDKNLFHTDDAGIYFTQDMNIYRIIIHPQFKPPKKYFDIALMELQQEVTFTWLMQPACLWTNHDVSELGDQATLTGWGVLAQGSIKISPELQAADVDLINSTYCDQLLHSSRNRNWAGLHEDQICAGKLAGGVDACQGDSGGPLQVKKFITGGSSNVVYHIIGVTSFGIGCALPNLPGVYTRVSSYIPWIESFVWPQA